MHVIAVVIAVAMGVFVIVVAAHEYSLRKDLKYTIKEECSTAL